MENRWILKRDGVVTNIFSSRQQAVKYFKEVLKVTLKDFDKQDKTNEYTYSIVIPKTEIIEVKERKSFLSLL